MTFLAGNNVGIHQNYLMEGTEYVDPVTSDNHFNSFRLIKSLSVR